MNFDKIMSSIMMRFACATVFTLVIALSCIMFSAAITFLIQISYLAAFGDFKYDIDVIYLKVYSVSALAFLIPILIHCLFVNSYEETEKNFNKILNSKNTN